MTDSESEPSTCYNPLCDAELSCDVDDDTEGYCSWDCAQLARSGAARRIMEGSR